MTTKKRVLSGMRSTGRLHLGNYVGALKTWIELQEKYDCYFMLADWHALTSDYADPSNLKATIRGNLMDWLAAGIDPERSVVFLQSLIKEHAELALILGMFTPTPWCERNPSYKDQIVQLANKDLETYGFLGYPVLQAADILVYRAHVVPVGEDQLAHLEITREIARRVNFLHGGPIESGTNIPENPIFPEPEPFLSAIPKLPGFDGRKMSKSYDNAIYLTDTADQVWEKTRQMVTDPARVKRTDKGDPEKCSVYTYHKLFTPDRTEEIGSACRGATIGCIDCKKILAGSVNAILEPMRERRAALESRPGTATEILADGCDRARKEAEATMAVVRERLNLAGSVEDLAPEATNPENSH
ncbi:MAG: tryptophan--tRNA ligase [Candidatus Sumerlaeaceae bacterium]|nr:tryptophan--tRNA ligase [Candidatus Sumerlaeaceae bacterium]